MTGTKRVLAQSTVVVELDSALAHFASAQSSAEIRDDLHARLEDLFEDLAIPAAPLVTLTRSAVAGERPLSCYRVTVNGDRCRVKVQPGNSQPAAVGELARMIAGDLLRNRELFLTRDLGERIRGAWLAERHDGPGALPAETFHALLAMLLELGVRLDRARSIALDARAPSLVRCRRALEELLTASTDAIGIQVLLNGARRDTLCAPGPAAAPAGDTRTLGELLPSATDRLFSDLGVLVPPPLVRTEPGLRDEEFRIRLNDLRWPAVEGLRAGEWLVEAAVSELDALGIEAAGAVHPLTGATCSRVRGDLELLRKCREAAPTLGAGGFIVLSVSAAARREAAHLLATDAVEWMLDALRDTQPALVDAITSRFDPVVLTWVFRDVLHEGASIRDAANVMEGLLTMEGSGSSSLRSDGTGPTLDVEYWSDWIRAELKRQISDRHFGDGRDALYLLTPDLEQRISDSIARPFVEDEHQQLVRWLQEAQSVRAGKHLVVLTTVDASRKLRRLIERELPDVAVISYQEVSPDTNLTPLARLGAGAG